MKLIYSVGIHFIYSFKGKKLLKLLKCRMTRRRDEWESLVIKWFDGVNKMIHKLAQQVWADHKCEQQFQTWRTKEEPATSGTRSLKERRKKWSSDVPLRARAIMPIQFSNLVPANKQSVLWSSVQKSGCGLAMLGSKLRGDNITSDCWHAETRVEHFQPPKHHSKVFKVWIPQC